MEKILNWIEEKTKELEEQKLKLKGRNTPSKRVLKAKIQILKEVKDKLNEKEE